MITIYHNPRCSKSRECNLMLEKLGKEVKVINYTKELFTVVFMDYILACLKEVQNIVMRKVKRSMPRGQHPEIQC